MTRSQWTKRIAPAATLVAVGVGLFATRIHAAAPAGRYTVATGTVYDTKTKLTWQQDVSPLSYLPDEAAQYCSTLSLAGTGWRLPTINEIVTLIDVSLPPPRVDPTFFPNTPMENFWTSSVFPPPAYQTAGGFVGTWYINLGSGTVLTNFTSPALVRTYRVRCVR